MDRLVDALKAFSHWMCINVHQIQHLREGQRGVESFNKILSLIMLINAYFNAHLNIIPHAHQLQSSSTIEADGWYIILWDYSVIPLGLGLRNGMGTAAYQSPRKQNNLFYQKYAHVCITLLEKCSSQSLYSQKIHCFINTFCSNLRVKEFPFYHTEVLL